MAWSQQVSASQYQGWTHSQATRRLNLTLGGALRLLKRVTLSGVVRREEEAMRVRLGMRCGIPARSPFWVFLAAVLIGTGVAAAAPPEAAALDSDGDGLSDFHEVHKYRTDPDRKSVV